MAALILKMWEVNLENQSLILEEKTANTFPEEFLNIKTVQFIDSSDINYFLKVFIDLHLTIFSNILN